ncbi:MAG TPA: isoprenylcysteine carboxylmethyltransferase family protein [Terriglobales bacterium]|nr:isoprenylcysteine carboxylmethyltransferase family protein [Terriglobales bacterium]
MSWGKVAKRIRVPLGFALAIAYILLARPTWMSLVFGAVVAFAGVGIRASASGHVKKNEELTTTGPYAYTRNPLYLGSIVIAAGFAIAAKSWWIIVILVVMFIAIYVPVIRGEEAYLRGAFPGQFDEYCRRVPRLLPRLTPGTRSNEGYGSFSLALYRKHREYNAALGTAAMLAALVAKLVWFQH